MARASLIRNLPETQELLSIMADTRVQTRECVAWLAAHNARVASREREYHEAYQRLRVAAIERPYNERTRHMAYDAVGTALERLGNATDEKPDEALVVAMQRHTEAGSRSEKARIALFECLHCRATLAPESWTLVDGTNRTNVTLIQFDPSDAEAKLLSSMRLWDPVKTESWVPVKTESWVPVKTESWVLTPGGTIEPASEVSLQRTFIRASQDGSHVAFYNFANGIVFDNTSPTTQHRIDAFLRHS